MNVSLPIDFTMLKRTLLKIYYFAFLSKERADANQKLIRNVEWDSIKDKIPVNSSFIDVGCGAGYNLMKAKKDRQCDCQGIDPEPGSHGVGRYSDVPTDVVITKGSCENIPFENKQFDIAFCSHVLEHVADEQLSLKEMKRVLKDDGTLIIGMPTATMAWISFLTQMILTTHMRVVNVLMRPFIKTGKQKFIHIFLPPSHSFYEKTILYDFSHYKIANWTKIVSKEFVIDETIKPALYPFPEYIQLFGMKKRSYLTSSVFFICRKR